MSQIGLGLKYEFIHGIPRSALVNSLHVPYVFHIHIWQSILLLAYILAHFKNPWLHFLAHHAVCLATWVSEWVSLFSTNTAISKTIATWVHHWQPTRVAWRLEYRYTASPRLLWRWTEMSYVRAQFRSKLKWIFTVAIATVITDSEKDVSVY